MKIHALYICFVVLSLPMIAHSEDGELNVDERNCLSHAIYEQVGSLGQAQAANRNEMGVSDLLKFVESQIPMICEKLIKYELKPSYGSHKECINFYKKTRDDLRQYYIDEQFEPDNISAELKTLHSEVLSKCQNSLSPKTVLELPNTYLSSIYSKAVIREGRLADEQKVLKEKNIAEENALAEKRETKEKLAATIKLAQQTERNFDVKGLSLKLSKQQVIALGGPKLWQCSKSKDDPAIDVCTLEPTGKKCISKSLIDPSTGGNVYDRQGQVLYGREECSNIPIAGMPPEVNKISTLGGKSVLSVNVGFFNGTLFEYQILIEGISPELKSGLIEKFGEPTVNNGDHMQWLGKDETLELLPANAEIVLYRPSLNELSKQHRATKIMADKKDMQEMEQKNEKAIAEQKKKDL